MARYLSKPQLIEAVEFKPEVRPWPRWVYQAGGLEGFAYYVLHYRTASKYILHAGDFIRVDTPEEFYAIDRESFLANYTEVPEDFQLDRKEEDGTTTSTNDPGISPELSELPCSNTREGGSAQLGE